MCVSVQRVSLNARDKMVEYASQKELEKKLKLLKVDELQLLYKETGVKHLVSKSKLIM